MFAHGQSWNITKYMRNLYLNGVKNGFSDLTKEQEGRDWQGKRHHNESSRKGSQRGLS